MLQVVFPHKPLSGVTYPAEYGILYPERIFLEQFQSEIAPAAPGKDKKVPERLL
jgi:hypothetical protein